MKRATLIALAVVLSACATIDAGEVAVEVVAGNPKRVITDPGYNTYFPLTTDIVQYPTRLQRIDFTRASAENGGYGPVEILTSEGAAVGVDMTVAVSVDKAMALEVYGEVGKTWGDVVNNVVVPQVRSIPRDVLANYQFETARTSSRPEVQAEILARLQAALADYGVIVHEVVLRDMPAPAALQEYINNRLEAEADLQEAKVRQEQSTVEAQTLQITRQAEADAKIIDAQSQVEVARRQAEAERIRAEGEAAANSLIARSLTPDLLELQIAQAYAGGTATIFFGGDAQPLVSVP